METCKIQKKIVSWKVNKSDNKLQSQQAQAKKRPKEVPCEIHTTKINNNKYVVIVGMIDDFPYEVFMGRSDKLSLPSKCSKGKIIKEDKGKYNLHIDINGEDLIVSDIIQTFDNKEFAWATRMLSMSLRHNVPIEFIVETLSKDGDIFDANKILARILKKYIKDGTKVKTSQKCNNCDNTDLVYQEGCLSCKNCGYSKCG